MLGAPALRVCLLFQLLFVVLTDRVDLTLIQVMNNDFLFVIFSASKIEGADEEKLDVHDPH